MLLIDLLPMWTHGYAMSTEVYVVQEILNEATIKCVKSRMEALELMIQEDDEDKGDNPAIK
jgi:hypothetical protein